MMKIFSFFLFATCLTASAGGEAQKVTLSQNNVKLEKVFREIKKQTGYVFFYEAKVLEKTKSVSVHVKDRSVEAVLKECLVGQPVDFSIQRRTVSIVPEEIIKSPGIGMNVSNLRENDLPLVQVMIISGSVKDLEGNPLAGVSVMVKGTQKGTSTDSEGNFSIDANLGEVLSLSIVGFKNKNVTIQNNNRLTIVMEIEEAMGSEVVVVAYGTQKKSEIVGSVTSIKPSELKIPSSNLTQALAGRLAGVISTQSSGEPGADNADFFIRGVATFGYRNGPLILIDNVESSTTDLARLQVDDIASFSIMKDASSTALYGAKGANGVILITTKEGRTGSVVVSARLENKLSQSVRNVKLADPITYMELANEANLTRDPLSGYRYSKSKIENTRLGIDPLVFPAVDWQKMLVKNNTMNQNANLSLSGGGGVARYYVSGSMSLDNGILKVDNKNNFNSNPKLKSYSIRSNVNIDLGKTTELQTKISGIFDDYTGPIPGGDAMFAQIMQTNPVLFPAYYQNTENTSYIKHIMFGNYGNAGYNNPYAELQKGYRESGNSVINAQIQLLQNFEFIAKGLTARGLVSIGRRASSSIVRSYNPFYYAVSNYDYFEKGYDLYPINAESFSGLQAPVGTEYLTGSNSSRDIASEFYSELAVYYKNRFKDKHNVSGTLVGIAKSSLNPGASNDLILSLPYRNLGVSGRATYVYDNRYAAEFNFGYNGSERFHSSRRWGFFPSIGGAYTISNEKFWEKYADIFSKFKVRATYGLVGNDAIGSITDRFFYLSSINLNSSARSASFGFPGNYTVNGVEISRYANSDITWEVAQKINLGLEFTLLKKLNVIAEVYKDKRRNILMTRASIPTTMGLESIPRANVGKATSKGVDLSLDYDFNITNEWWLKGLGNFTYAVSKYTEYEEPVFISQLDGKTVYLDNLTHVGKSLSQKWGFIAERLFVDNKDAANSPLQSFGPYGGGDIKYRDINKDGQITDLDKVPIGFPTTPEIVYGFGFSTGYKSFDFSVFFQGLARRSFWIDARATSPFVGDQRLLLDAYAQNHWSEDNRDIYALWPRLSPIVNENNVQTSTWFMRNGSLLRVKQVEVGYTPNRKFLDKLSLSNVRFYLNSNNLFTFSKFKLWDVEMAGNGLAYPIQRITNVGINISFK